MSYERKRRDLAIRRLLRFPGLRPDVVRRLRFRHRAFEEVTTVSYAARSVPGVPFNRLNEHWRSAAELARLILDEKSLRDEVGGTVIASFTIDMNALFECFVEEVVDREARKVGLRPVAQAPRRLSANVPIRPDLVLRGGGSDVAVGDAKYREPWGDRPTRTCTNCWPTASRWA